MCLTFERAYFYGKSRVFFKQSANNAYVPAKFFHRASLRVSSLKIYKIISNKKGIPE